MDKEEKIKTVLVRAKAGGVSEFALLEHLLKKVLLLQKDCHTFIKPELTFKAGRLVGMKIHPEDHVRSIDFSHMK